MDQISEYKLKVVAGVHKNAELILNASTRYAVGSGDECDIILMDEGVAENHLSLFFLDNHVYLKKRDGDVFVDGAPVQDSKTPLKPFQIVTAGQAHFTIGIANGEWPLLKPPLLEERIDSSDSKALMLLPDDSEKKDKIGARFVQHMGKVYEAVAGLNRRVLLVLAVFSLLFFIFWMDFLLSGILSTGDEPVLGTAGEEQTVNHKSLILSVIQMMVQLRETTLVGAGVEEPPIDVTQEKQITATDSTQVVRNVLKEHWGGNLTEIPKANGEIEFKGHDSSHQTDLQISINKENDGSLSAQGFTLSKRQRKEVMAKLGDVIHVKVVAADDVEHLCRKTLQKKQVKQPNAHFNIEDNAITLEGRSSDQQAVSEIEQIIARIMPNVAVDNQIRFEPGSLGIVGASTSGIAHVKLSDGSKVFPGGKLKNGCTVVGIDSHRIELNCHGATVYHSLN